nr:glycosyltransferase family 4 protein [Sulfobacillus harzensis]
MTNRGYELIPLSLEVPRIRKIVPILRTLEFKGGRFRAYSSLHPDTYRAVRMPDNLRQVPAFVFGDGVILSEAPHYFYRDLDYRTVMEFRDAGLPTFMYDHFPSKLLHLLADHQTEVFERAAGIFTMSQWIRERMIAHGIPEERVHWVGAGANISSWPASNPYEPSNVERGRFLFVGRDFDRKGGPLVLEAWRRVVQEMPNAQLIIIGPEARSTDVLGVSWLGPQPSSVVTRELATATAFVLPSLWEAYGIAFLEAMAYGVPVIGSNRMAMPEFIRPGETGDLVIHDNPNELAEMMLRFVREPDRTWHMSQNAYQEAQKYRWPTVAERIETVWRNG